MESRILKLIECIKDNKSPELSRMAAFQLGQLSKESGPEIYEKILPLFHSSNTDLLKYASQALNEILINNPIACGPCESPLTLSSLQAPSMPKKKQKLSSCPFSALLSHFRNSLTDSSWEGKFSALLGVRVLFMRTFLCEECEEDFICRVLISIFEDNTGDYSGDLAVFPIRNSGAEILALARQDLKPRLGSMLEAWKANNLIAFLLTVRKGKFFLDWVYCEVLRILESKENEDVVTEACHYLDKFPLAKDQRLADLILMIIEKSDTLSGFIKYAIRVLDKLFHLGCELLTVHKKIYVFFVHSLTEVRISTLSAYKSLALKGIQDYETIFMLTMQLLLLETNKQVISKSLDLLKVLIYNYDLKKRISDNMNNWIEFLSTKVPNNFSFFLKPDPALTVQDQYSFADSNTEEDIKSSNYLEKKYVERLWRVGNFLFAASLKYSSFISLQKSDCLLSILSCLPSEYPHLLSISSKDSEGKFDLIRQKYFAVHKIVKLCWNHGSVLPEKITSIFQSVVTAYKHEPTEFLREKISKTAARLTFLLKPRVNIQKFIENLLKIFPLNLLRSLQKVHKSEIVSIVSLYSDLASPSSLLLTTEHISEPLQGFFIKTLPTLFSQFPNEPLIQPLCNIFSQVPSSLPPFISFTLAYLSEHPLPYLDPLKILRTLLKASLVSLIPYSTCIVLPLLSHLNTENSADVSAVFSEILYAVVLDQDSDVPEDLKPAKEAGLSFLANLKGLYSLPKYSPRVSLKGLQLREYQKEGVAWMRFLAQFRLGGLLCDEMGLGKTIQSLCAISEAHIDSPSSSSLIVCPASVVGHWVKEAKNYLDLPVHEFPLAGPGLMVISYNSLMSSIGKLKNTQFLYAVLDEGHLLSNPKTKTFKAVKMIQASYRLILTGTPIQNKILDVWPFFDFLMPGFLGSQSEFSAIYQKHLKAKKVANQVKFKDEHVALQKLAALHKKILPFTLRRLKKDILQDLPEKIIQDYYVDASYTQLKLIKSRQDLNSIQNFSFLEKVCVHPGLVDDSLIGQESGKLEALKDLLNDCEICEETGASHKALIFSKSKKVLDLIENLVILANFPETQYLRLDGKTPMNKRFEICSEFNTNIAIRLLLITTKTGGLGLNLQAASVVIFVDHSWNPVTDLQAMDRAHRLGQKKVVNVYRLITRDTFEEEVLGLQAFKTKIAESLVNAENSTMSSVDSFSLLDSINHL